MGLDMLAALELADSYGYDRAVMAELLRYAEQGMLAGVKQVEEKKESGNADSQLIN